MAEAYCTQGIACLPEGVPLRGRWIAFTTATDVEPFNAVYLNNPLPPPSSQLSRTTGDDHAEVAPPAFLGPSGCSFGALGIASEEQQVQKGRRALSKPSGAGPRERHVRLRLWQSPLLCSAEGRGQALLHGDLEQGYSGDDGGTAAVGKAAKREATDRAASPRRQFSGSGREAGAAGGPEAAGRASPRVRPRPPSPGARGGERRGVPQNGWATGRPSTCGRGKEGERPRGEHAVRAGHDGDQEHLNLQTLACVKKLSMELRSDGSIFPATAKSCTSTRARPSTLP